MQVSRPRIIVPQLGRLSGRFPSPCGSVDAPLVHWSSAGRIQGADGFLSR